MEIYSIHFENTFGRTDKKLQKGFSNVQHSKFELNRLILSTPLNSIQNEKNPRFINKHFFLLLPIAQMFFDFKHFFLFCQNLRFLISRKQFQSWPIFKPEFSLKYGSLKFTLGKNGILQTFSSHFSVFTIALLV